MQPLVASEATPVRLFEDSYEAYLKAESASTTVESWHSIAGSPVCLRFAGTSLVDRIIPALEHLATQPAGSPALTVCLWESASFGVGFLAPSPEFNGKFRVRLRGVDNRILGTLYPDCDLLCMLDSARSLALYNIRDVSQHPFYEYGSPLLVILSWWAQTRGLTMVHAGAVGRLEGGVLLAGKGGSGKSTTALACLNSGLLYAGDDHCLLEPGRPPFVHSIYSSAKLAAERLDKLPRLRTAAAAVESQGAEKAIIFLGKHNRAGLSAGFPVRAVFAPRVTGRTGTSLTPLSPIGALRALAPSTIFETADAGPFELEAMTGLVKRVPSFTLELGTDLERIPRIITEFLRG